MLKIGLEKEFFVLRNLIPVVCPTQLPYDGSGLLAEARGDAYHSVYKAVCSLQADCLLLEDKVKKLNAGDFEGSLTLSASPAVMKIDRTTRLQASRQFEKGLTQYQNLYGYQFHRNSQSEQTAGVHISFTYPMDFTGKDGNVFTLNRMFDWVQLFKKLDVAFREEIKESKRNPGFYELKTDGRIEYRSLPANVDMNKVIHVLNEILSFDNFHSK